MRRVSSSESTEAWEGFAVIRGKQLLRVRARVRDYCNAQGRVVIAGKFATKIEAAKA